MENKRTRERQRLLTAGQVADLLGLAPGTVRNKAATGEIPSLRIGGARRFDVRDLEALIEAAKRRESGED